MKEGITNIDSIRLMIDTYNQNDQYEVLHNILHEFSTVPLTFIRSVTQPQDESCLGIGEIKKVHKVMYKGKMIATATTGRYITSCYGVTDCIDVYYVAVSFYGLTRHHVSDIGSRQCLLALCKHLNTNQIIFRITQLDICFDIHAPFENVLTILAKRAPNARYFPPDETQDNGKIRRIEDVPVTKYSKARVRAYTYNKTARNNWIKHDMTRFELKLNSIFFKGVEKPMPAIKKAVDKYTIMYFDNLKKRATVLEQYKAQWLNNKLDVKKLGADKYTLAIDIDYVSEFIEMLYAIDADVPYSYLMPTRDKEALAREENKNLQ